MNKPFIETWIFQCNPFPYKIHVKNSNSWTQRGNFKVCLLARGFPCLQSVHLTIPLPNSSHSGKSSQQALSSPSLGQRQLICEFLLLQVCFLKYLSVKWHERASVYPKKIGKTPYLNWTKTSKASHKIHLPNSFLGNSLSLRKPSEKRLSGNCHLQGCKEQLFPKVTVSLVRNRILLLAHWPSWKGKGTK